MRDARRAEADPGSLCVVCHTAPLKFRCIQCHKPVCDECSFKTGDGAFCSRECATSYRDFMAAKKHGEELARARRRRKRQLTLLVAAALIAGIAIGVLLATGLLPAFR